MQLQQFNLLINSHSLVLVDLYADWCEPCKLLDVILDELQEKTSGSLAIEKIDADASEEIKEAFHIRSVPVLLLFKNGSLVWRMNGFMMADELEKKVREFAVPSA